MSAALVWILFPFGVGVVLLPLLRYRRMVYIVAAAVTALLAILAATVTINVPIELGIASLKIEPSFSILGRRLVLDQFDQTILAVINLFALFWLIGGLYSRVSSILAPAALMIPALSIATLAVEPFLYSALLIEGMVLVSIPLLSAPFSEPRPGVVRYLVFQTIGMPFLLLTGWLLGGMESAPLDVDQTVQILIFLGVGFAFTLAIFPLYSWIPMLAEDEEPYLVGFILLVLPTSVMLFLLTFIDRYAWLRTSVNLPAFMQYAGVLMVVTGGIGAGFQKNLARIFGYAVIVENGFAVLAMGLMTLRGNEIFANMLLARMFSFGLWAIALEAIKRSCGSLLLADVQGLARVKPMLAVSILIAQFTIGGLPLLAGFPLRIALIEELSMQSTTLAWLIIPGMAGIWAGGLYSLYVMLLKPEQSRKSLDVPRSLSVLMAVGIAFLVFLGLFPQVFSPVMVSLLNAFPRLLIIP